MIEKIKQMQAALETQQVQTLKQAIHANIEDPEPFWKRSYEHSEDWCKTFNVHWRKVVADQSEASQRNQMLFGRQLQMPRAEKTDLLPCDQASLT
jgi:hypothetical protein